MHKSEDVVSTLMEGVEVEVTVCKEAVELTKVMEDILQITKGSGSLVQAVAAKGGMVIVHELMGKRKKPKNNHDAQKREKNKMEKPKRFRASSAALHQTRAYMKSNKVPKTIKRNN